MNVCLNGYQFTALPSKGTGGSAFLPTVVNAFSQYSNEGNVGAVAGTSVEVGTVVAVDERGKKVLFEKRLSRGLNPSHTA